ncbi:TPA: hypothetical protein ACE8XT_002211, partial [Neisseria gonorrhoeae]
RAVSVFSDKFLKLKISSFLQKQKIKNRNLKSRHSHESGNPESLKLQLTFEYCCCSKVWIPACAGMTAERFLFFPINS